MSIFEALILGIVQGAAEFLPISSSGHLVLIPWWLGWDDPPLIYDVTVHVGTTLAVIAFFWRDWLRLSLASLAIMRKRNITEPDEWLLVFLGIGTIPVAIVGLLLEKHFSALSNPTLAAFMLLVTAGILTFSERMSHTQRSLESMTLVDTVFIGCAQAVAIIPGISRSGSTIAGGLLRNFNREDAARFSFLLATPAILGAGVFQLIEVLSEDVAIDGELGTALVVGFVSSVLVGYASIALLLGFVRRRRLYPFAVYCVIFGLVSLAAVLLRG